MSNAFQGLGFFTLAPGRKTTGGMQWTEHTDYGAICMMADARLSRTHHVPGTYQVQIVVDQQTKGRDSKGRVWYSAEFINPIELFDVEFSLEGGRL